MTTICGLPLPRFDSKSGPVNRKVWHGLCFITGCNKQNQRKEKETMKEKKIFLGSTKPDTYDRRPLPITLEISLEEKSGMEHFQTTSLTPIPPPALVLSISGSIGSQAGGQIDEELKRLLASDGIDYRPGWDGHRLALLLQIWERWHLNDMKSGCIHQSTAEARKEITLVKVKVNPWKIRDEET